MRLKLLWWMSVLFTANFDQYQHELSNTAYAKLSFVFEFNLHEFKSNVQHVCSDWKYLTLMVQFWNSKSDSFSNSALSGSINE